MAEFPAAAFRLDGDPGAIRGSAGSYASFGALASSSAAQVRSLDTSLFLGPEGDQYRAGLTESLPPHLDRTGEAYSLVASALTTFAGALSGLQDRMAPLAVRAPGLWQDLQTAQGSLAAAQAADRVHAQLRAAEAATANATHPLPPDSYVSEAGAAGGALSAAEQAWHDCLAAAGQVKTDHAVAVDACASTIRRASGMRFKRNPHGLGAVWSGVTHFVKDHIADLARLSHALKALAIHAGVFLYNGLADVVNGAASFGTALMHDPRAAFTLALGMALVTVGAGGEVFGIALDATGVGASAGVALNVSAAAALTAGLGLTGTSGISLAHAAAGPDRITVMHHKSTGDSGAGGSSSEPGTSVDYPNKAAARQALDGNSRKAANKFFRDSTSKSEGFRVTQLDDGGHRLQFFSPANNPGYGKLYVQEIDAAGTRIREYKDTIGPEGLIERKWIFGGPS